MGNITSKIIDSEDSFYNIKAEWDALILDSDTFLLPLSHQWLQAWWRYFSDGCELHIMLFYDGDNLISIAPFLVAESRYRNVPVRVLRLMANGHSPFCDLIYRSGVKDFQKREIFSAICDSSTVDTIDFCRLPVEGPTHNLLVDFCKKSSYKFGCKAGLATPVIEISRDWDIFFGSLSKKFRKNIRNKCNRFTKKEGTAIEKFEIETAGHPAVIKMVEISKNSWKAEKKTDLSNNDDSLFFLHRMINFLGPMGGVELWLASIDDQAIAYELHFMYGGVTYPIRADFSEEYRHLSPGSVLEYSIIKDFFEKPRVDTYDSCADSYWYLSNWSKVLKHHCDVEVFRGSFKSSSLYLVEYRVIPLLKRLRQKMRKNDE
jgi:CelD/BcsL family acetyltransferase involved in cellulose biosynthesis